MHTQRAKTIEISFEKDYLRELFYEGKTSDRHHRYQPEIVKRYIRVINILESVEKPVDLFRFRSLHYEKLIGDKVGLESVRVNKQYRVEFKSQPSGEITICRIIDLSNHYK